jgi:hypothetical protein
MSVFYVPYSRPARLESPEGIRTGMATVSDEELGDVSGGMDIVFRGDGVDRDSWFASFMTKRMIRDRIRSEFDPASAGPVEMTIGGRRFRVSAVGDTVYVDEM